MKNSFVVGLILLIVVGTGCDEPAKQPKEKKVIKLEGLVQHHYKDGSLASEITYKDKKKHGNAKGYFPNGSLQGEFTYEEDKLHGLTKMYYENGKLFRETTFKQGKIDGIQKLYRSNGTLLAEVPYKDGELGVGTIEYTKAGKPKKKLPTLQVEQINNLLKNNQYIVRLTLSEKDSKARFYYGELIEGKYKGSHKLSYIPTKNGIAELVYTIPPGAFIMEKMQFVAETETKMGTPYLLRQQVNIAAENKGY